VSDKEILYWTQHMDNEKFDLDRSKEQAMKSLYQSKKMAGPDGAFCPHAETPF